MWVMTPRHFGANHSVDARRLCSTVAVNESSMATSGRRKTFQGSPVFPDSHTDGDVVSRASEARRHAKESFPVSAS